MNLKESLLSHNRDIFFKISPNSSANGLQQEISATFSPETLPFSDELKNETKDETKKQIYLFGKRLQQILCKFGIYLPLESEHTPLQIAKLETPTLIKILQQLQFSLETLEQSSVVGTSFQETIQSLWHLYSRFGWKIEDQIISQIAKGDVVEIYLPDGTQVYRNLEYFKKTSYSIIDLLIYPWTQLIDHDPHALKRLMMINRDIFSNPLPLDTLPKIYHIEPYLASECFSPLRYQARLTSKFLTPIADRRTKIAEAVLVVWQIEILNLVAPMEPLNLSKERHLG